jgi:hypothetical protein
MINPLSIGMTIFNVPNDEAMPLPVTHPWFAPGRQAVASQIDADCRCCQFGIAMPL